MNNRKCKYGLYSLIFILFLLFSCLACTVEVANKNVPKIVEYRKGINSVNFTQDYYLNKQDIEDIRILTDINVCGSYSKYYNIYTSDMKYSEACIVFTDEYYQRIHKVPMISGSFFDTELKYNYVPVVIGSALREKLFIGQNVVGYPLQINGVDCVIAGVYKEYDTITMEHYVYAPYNFMEGDNDIKLETIALLSDENIPVFSMSRDFTDSLLKKLNHYDRIDYFEVFKGDTVAFSVLCIIIFLIVLMISIFNIKKLIVGCYIIIRKNIDNHKALRRVFFDINFIKKTLWSLFLCLFIILSFKIIDGINIPYSYLSKDNIFDARYFVDCMINNYRKLGNYNDRANLLNMLNIMGVSVFGLCVVCLSLLCIIMVLLKYYKWDSKYSPVIFVAMGILGSLCGGVIISTNFGILSISKYIIMLIFVNIELVCNISIFSENCSD